ncbi:pancreatic lipase-related protein 2-like [Condylostylus longicornis]|uniref:pancreatic lipase-related protein 2-like n=1 Tax=Condylostylus longicornis TaxID=2530218 RepID=UPI00244DA0CA|nr:pancreatic lipase-related protein 2-like [Condylostylus longicornis]
MLAYSNQFLELVFINLVLVFLVPTFCIILDSNDCEKSTQLRFPNITDPEIRYYLFTRDNILEGTEIKDQDVLSLQNSKFNKEWPTRIFINSWKTTAKHCKIAVVRDAYFEIGDFNFILVDWSDYNTKEYTFAAASVNDVGKLVGNFTKFLNTHMDVSFDDMYLIGHGLGAHVAGAVGESILPNQFNTIYGLDPTGTDFVETSTNNRLDPSDAKYVEVVVTDMYYNGFSTNETLGHAQFYPNNGRRVQPSCPHYLIRSFSPGDQFCSHTSSIDYFANSLNSKIKFCGKPTTWDDIFSMLPPINDGVCDILMGGEPSVPKSGYYYLFVGYSDFLPA